MSTHVTANSTSTNGRAFVFVTEKEHLREKGVRPQS